MSQGPFKIETKIGNVWITATQGDHIYVDFGSNLVAEEGPENCSRRGPVTVRGVKYSGSLHLFLWPADGSFHLGRQGETSYKCSLALYMSKLSARNYADSYPTDAAKRAVVEVVVPLVDAWVKANAPVLEAAEREHKQREREKRQQEISELRAKIADLEKEIKALEEGEEEFCAVCGERAVDKTDISINNRPKENLAVCQIHKDAADEDGEKEEGE